MWYNSVVNRRSLRIEGWNMALKLSIRENMAPGRTLLEKFQNLRELGFDGIELTTSSDLSKLDEIKEAMKKTGIQPSITSARGGALLDARKEERDLAVQKHKEALTLAAEIGAVGVLSVPLIAVKMGGRPRIPDLSPLAKTEELERKLLVELYREICEHAEKVGAYLIIEPLNRYEQWWPNTLADAVSICKEVGHPNCRIMADLFHMNIEEVDMAESIRQAGDYIVNVHLADSNRLTPGHGHTDFKSVFRALKDIGYSYFCALECGIPGDRVGELKRTVEYLRRIYDEA